VSKRLVATWIVVLLLGCVAWVAFTRHSLVEFVGMVAGLVCALFIVDCVETATKRNVLTFRFAFVVVAVIEVLGLVHVPEIASTPIALIVAWKFDDFVLRYSAAKAIRKLTGLGPDEVVRLSTDELSERIEERREE